MRIKRVVLEHHGDIALHGFELVDHGAADGNGALGDAFETGDHAQKCGLAAARRADQDDELAVPDAEVDAFDRLEAARIDLAYAG